MRPLSSHKIDRLYQLFFEGLPQHTIAKRLDISQGAVSMYANQLADMAKELGVESVLEEGIAMDEIKELRDLALDLRKAHMTPEECRCGLKTRLALAKCGVGPDDYGHLAKCAQQMNADGHIDAAIRLAKLEAKTGLSYEHLLNTYEDTCHKLENKQLELSKASADAESAKKERANAIQERKTAVAELEDAMQKVGLDGARLTRVEALALAVKKAGADNTELDAYLERQQALNQAGVTIERFTDILKETAVLTGHDNGAGLLAMLKEYGGLSAGIDAARSHVTELEKQAVGWAERIKDKQAAEKALADIKTERTAEQKALSLMEDKRQELVDTKAELQGARSALSLVQEKTKACRQELSDVDSQLEIQKAALKDTVGDLDKVKTEREAVLADLAQARTETAGHKRELEILHSFEGLIAEQSWPVIDKFVELLPQTVAHAKAKGHSPSLLRERVLRELTGGSLRVLYCTSCNVRIITDGPRDSFHKSDHCTRCGYAGDVKEMLDETALLRAALTPPRATSTGPFVVTATSQPKLPTVKLTASVPVENAGPPTEPKQHP